jgi:hypothetical protein
MFNTIKKIKAMSTLNTQCLDFNGLEQGKNKQFKAQLQRVYHALKERPMTMKETDVYTGVMRENICRYIDTLLEQGKIAILRKRKCTITGYPNVNEYTSNPALFPQSNQLKMF